MATVHSSIGKSQPNQQSTNRVLVVDDQDRGGAISFNTPEARFKTAMQNQQSTSNIIDGNVSTATEDVDETMKRILDQKKTEALYKNRLLPNDKNILDKLLGLAKNETIVVIDDTVFLLRSLKGKERKLITQQTAWLSANEIDRALIAKKSFGDILAKLGEVYALRELTLALAIKKIDDIDFELIINSDQLEVKHSFVEELEETVLDRLYQAYADMSAETSLKLNSKIEIEQLDKNLKK